MDDQNNNGSENVTSNQENSPTTRITSAGNLIDNHEVGDPNAVLQAFEEERNPKPKIPEKFQNKSLEDVVKSYQELEQLSGKQAQELGELRKLTDSFIKDQLEKSSAERNRKPTEDKDQSVRQFEDNVLAANEDDDPAVAKAKELLKKELEPYHMELQELKKDKFLAKLSKDHGDFEQIVADTEFQNWVMESPARVNLFKQADLNFDFDSANELFNNWKERTGKKQRKDMENEQKAATDKAFEKSQMETSNVDESTPVRKYRRADIIELMRTNPERYRTLEPEIMRAYAEGRVY